MTKASVNGREALLETLNLCIHGPAQEAAALPESQCQGAPHGMAHKKLHKAKVSKDSRNHFVQGLTSGSAAASVYLMLLRV